MKKTTAKKVVKGSDTYKLDRVRSFVEIEQKGTITVKEAMKNIADILEVQPIVKLRNHIRDEEMSFRCVESLVEKMQEHYVNILEFKWLGGEEWFEVTDLSFLKVSEYNELVEKMQEHYPEFDIEPLAGRFV